MENGFVNAGWTVGYYCNAGCRHCYSKQGRSETSVLEREEMIIILDKLSKFGIKTINFGGNEPIFTNHSNIENSNLPYLIYESKIRNITIGITTNSTTTLHLHEHYPSIYRMVDDWDISIDSPFENEHDQNRDLPLYAKAMKAMDILSSDSRERSFVYCLMNWNCSLQHARELGLLAAKYDASIRVNTLKPTSAFHASLLPSVKQINVFFKELSNYFDTRHNTDLSSCIGGYLYNCPCGTSSFSIASKREDGTVPIAPCVYLQQYAMGDLLEDNLVDIIRSPVFLEFNKRSQDMTLNCRKRECQHSYSCRGGCVSYTILSETRRGEPDPRCPILNGDGSEIAFCKSYTQVNKKVHENYLCTWIGERKHDQT